MYVEMKVVGVVVDAQSKSPVVLLKDPGGQYTLPIWIGLLEAASIAYALEGAEPPRPMTHDLMKMLLEEVGAQVPRIDIDNLSENVFHAKIHLEVPGGGVRLVDSRPSDALALALRTGSPIYAEEKVLRRASSIQVKAAEGDESEEKDPWKEFLEGLDPEDYGKYKM